MNPTNKDLILDEGVISRKILQEAGDMLQIECFANYPNGIPIQLNCGIAVTSAGELKNFKNIFHLTMPPFSNFDCFEKHVNNKEFRLEYIC